MPSHDCMSPRPRVRLFTIIITCHLAIEVKNNHRFIKYGFPHKFTLHYGVAGAWAWLATNIPMVPSPLDVRIMA